MIDQQTIDEAARLLYESAPKGSQVILFGSYARGEARSESDLDFLVVEPRVASRLKEAARLDRAIRGIRVSVDVVVVSRQAFDYWKDTPNTLPYEAMREGKVFHAGA